MRDPAKISPEFPMLKIQAQPLRRQLVVGTLLFFVLMLAAAVALGLDEFREAVEELSGQTETMAVRTASAIERELTGIDRIARRLSAEAALQDLDADAVERLLRAPLLQRPELIDVVLIDRDGRAVARETHRWTFPRTGRIWPHRCSTRSRGSYPPCRRPVPDSTT